MMRFVALVRAIELSPDAETRRILLVRYLSSISEQEATWAALLLMGKTPARRMTVAECAAWFRDASALPSWLVDVCDAVTDDPIETAALGLPAPLVNSGRTLASVMETLGGLKGASAADRRVTVQALWQELNADARLVVNTLLRGDAPVVLPTGEIARAAAEVFGGSAPMIEHLLLEDGAASSLHSKSLRTLAESTAGASDPSRPYPFPPSTPLVSDLSDLGSPAEWIVGWHYEGIRVQLVRRNGRAFLWEESGDLVSTRFPDVVQGASALPDGTVIEGWILLRESGGGGGLRQHPPSTRRDKPIKPAKGSSVMLCRDLLELEGIDFRERPLGDRLEWLQSMLNGLLPGATLRGPEPLPSNSWEDVAAHWAHARSVGASGISLRRKAAGEDPLLVWPVDPFRLDAVLLYAEQGGRTGSSFSKFTLAVWEGKRLVPLAAVKPILPQGEAQKVFAYISGNTTEKFGPVRTVRPGLVFEIAFDALAASGRHKSGVALRNPRILRWRPDLAAESAATLQALRRLLSP